MITLSKIEFVAYTVGMICLGGFLAAIVTLYMLPKPIQKLKVARRPMTGFIATMTPEQIEAAKKYTGPDTQG